MDNLDTTPQYTYSGTEREVHIYMVLYNWCIQRVKCCVQICEYYNSNSLWHLVNSGVPSSDVLLSVSHWWDYTGNKNSVRQTHGDITRVRYMWTPLTVVLGDNHTTTIIFKVSKLNLNPRCDRSVRGFHQLIVTHRVCVTVFQECLVIIN